MADHVAVARRRREDVEAQRACRGHLRAVGALFGVQAEGVCADWEIVPDHRHSGSGVGRLLEEDWIPLRSPDFYKEHRIDLRLATRVAAIEPANRKLRLTDASELAFDALLLAPGADPVRLDIKGGDLPHVHYLRTLADSRALVTKFPFVRRAVVIGASFIGLEVAASLRARNIAVDVVAPETIPMERILGPDAGNFIRQIHAEHGVKFHLGTTVVSITEQSAALENGENLEADLVVVGIGVRPLTSLAAQAGLSIDRGVAVNEYLETRAPGIFAAGDIARWPDRLTGESISVEHLLVSR